MYSNLWIFEHLFCQPDPSISGKCVISFQCLIEMSPKLGQKDRTDNPYAKKKNPERDQTQR